MVPLSIAALAQTAMVYLALCHNVSLLAYVSEMCDSTYLDPRMIAKEIVSVSAACRWVT